LAHYLKYNTNRPGAYSHSSGASESARIGTEVARSKGVLFETAEGFYAEYYQFGRYITYGGQR